MSGWIILAIWPVASLTTARFLYRRLRPYSEPLSCTTPATCSEGHKYGACYARVYGIDGPASAYVVALLGGLIWPLFAVLLALYLPVTGGKSRETPAELHAKIARLERDLEIKS